MISRRKGHSGTWPPFSPRAYKTNPSSPQTLSPLTLENAPRRNGARIPPSRPGTTREVTRRSRKRRLRERKAGEGESSETRLLRRPSSPLRHYHHHPLLVLDVSPPTTLPSPRARWGLTKSTSRARSFDSCRSLARSFVRAESIGAAVFRDAQRSSQASASASELGKEDASHRRVYSYEGRSAEVTGNPAGSSLSRLSPSLRLMLQTNARLSSLILRVVLR